MSKEKKYRVNPVKLKRLIVDESSVKIFDEKTSIFNPFTVEDYTAFYTDQKKSVEEKVKSWTIKLL